MPPVETMTVRFPALSASRTSIHVISSIQIVSGAGSGLGVSMQLYGLALQLPPPALRGSAGGRSPRPRPCACGCGGSAASALMRLATGTVHAQHAQDEPLPTNLWFLRAGYSPGIVLAASPFVSGDNGARAMTVEVGRQTDGTRDWHRVYNYPSYGVGFYAGRFDHERELGHPFGAYGFFSWPFPISDRVHV